MNGWKVVTPRAPTYDAPPDGLPFVLTPRERDMAAVWQLQLERDRRERNKRDTAQQAADALARFDAEVTA